jgi:hypothetical protein
LNVELPLTLSENGEINLLNSSGQLLKTVRAVSNRALIDLSSLPHGFYYLTIYSKGTLMHRVKFIKD